MDEGDHYAALLTLDRAATTLGPILPSNPAGPTRSGGARLPMNPVRRVIEQE